MSSTPEGKRAASERFVYQTSDLKIKFMHMKLRGMVNHKDVYDIKIPEYDKWNEFVKQ